MTRVFVGVLVFGMVALSSAAVAQDGPMQGVTGFVSESTEVSLEPIFEPLPAGVEVLQLENGVQVVLMPNQAQPMVGIYCQVKVGSAWEDFATSGMSHMLEHLLFNGTELYTQDELYEAADQASAYNNAHTTDFYTDYMMVLPAANIATGLELQSQMLFHSVIPVEKFPKEQGIVLGELAMSRDRGDPFYDNTFREAVFGGSSLALPTLGTAATIEALDREAVYDFYKSWYVPNNMILSLVGRFDREEALDLVEQYYGRVAPRSLPELTLIPARPITRTETVVRRGGGRRIASLTFAAPEYGAPDHTAFRLAVDLLTADGSGILTLALDDLPEADRPALSVWWQSAPGYGRYIMEFELTSTTDPESLYRLVQDAVTGALEAGLQAGDLAAVVARERTQLLKQREQLRMTGIYIAEDLVQAGPDWLLTTLDRLSRVTVDDASAAIRRWLVNKPCLAVMVEPAASYDDDAGAPAAVQIVRDDLPGGAVLVTQTDPNSELMAVHLTVRDRGLLDMRDGQPGALNLVHRLLTTGVSGCDEACLSRRLGAIGGQIKLVDNPRFPMDNYYTNGRFSFIRLECPAEYGAEALQLLTELIQHSTFTSADLDRERQAQLMLLRRSEGSAGATSRSLLVEGLYGDHPQALPAEGTTASVSAIEYDALRSLYRRAFRPENLIVAVVSPYTHDAVAHMLNGLPTDGSERAATEPVPVTEKPARLEASLSGPMGSIRVGSVRSVAEADQPALSILVAVLSDRLVMDLRETRGLGYSVGAGLKFHGGRGVFSASVNPPKARLAEGEEALAEALRTFDAATITQDELDAARNSRRGRLMMRRLDSISRAYYLAMAELEHGDVSSYERDIVAYDEVTLADLQRVAGFFSELPLVTVVVD